MSKEQLRPTPAKELLSRQLRRVVARKDAVEVEVIQDCALLDIARAMRQRDQMTKGVGAGEDLVMQRDQEIGDKMRGKNGENIEQFMMIG